MVRDSKRKKNPLGNRETRRERDPGRKEEVEEEKESPIVFLCVFPDHFEKNLHNGPTIDLPLNGGVSPVRKRAILGIQNEEHTFCLHECFFLKCDTKKKKNNNISLDFIVSFRSISTAVNYPNK